ncbi:MAG TPA: hypothetical protein VLB73_02475 [Patescibacteria group bacterium]|nr:hypothetical protein [Patescibacteria group bacterium]
MRFGKRQPTDSGLPRGFGDVPERPGGVVRPGDINERPGGWRGRPNGRLF